MKNNIILIFIWSSLLSGCALQSLPSVDVYTLDPQWHEQPIQTEKNRWRDATLKLAPTHGGRSFSTTDIVYRDPQHGHNSYAYSRWSDAPVRLMHTYIQVALERSGQFLAVVPSVSVSEADYLLESTLLDLSHHIKGDGGTEGTIRMRFYLINQKTSEVLATKEFLSVVAAQTNNAEGGVAALNQGASNLVRDFVVWVRELGSY